MDQSGPIMADCDPNSLMLSHPSDLSPTVRIDAQISAQLHGATDGVRGSHADAVQSGGANGYAPRGARTVLVTM